MSYKLSKFIYLLFLSFVSVNCASIIHGNKQDVYFTSQPTGATLYIDDHKVGPTPKTIRLPRKGRIVGENSAKKSYKIKIEMEGYLPYEIYVRRDVDNWLWGNLFFGGIFGIAIDAATGAMYKLTPDQVVGTLPQDSRNGSVKNKDSIIYIVASLKIDPSWEKIGYLEKRD
jgi:PEGA domain